jgi:predicted dienelactone hydrolase
MPVRSPYEQAEYPRPASAWGQKLLRSIHRIVDIPKQTYIPYHPRNLGTFGRFVRWQNRWAPVATALMTYKGEAPLRLQPLIVLPHPSGLDPFTKVTPPEE